VKGLISDQNGGGEDNVETFYEFEEMASIRLLREKSMELFEQFTCARI